MLEGKHSKVAVEKVKEQFRQKQMIHRVGQRQFCIGSLQKELGRVGKMVEEVTASSMVFFEEYFGHPYVFAKYDQVFAHEYKWGAMENAGIVTLNDLYLFRDRVSEKRLFDLCNTVVHEMAHHWFGNLVTMRWWDDLWLNESFAQFISHYCLDRIKLKLTHLPRVSPMLAFYQRKAWGYAEDELITTHPIRGEVSNTQAAQSIFDGITYSKGAAVLKQLMFLIGEEAFSRSLKQYFHRHAFSNATLDDFLFALSPHFPHDLNKWKHMWLETAGTNTIRCQWTKGSPLLQLKQDCVRPDHPTLRLHRIRVGIVNPDFSVTTLETTVEPQSLTEVSHPAISQALALLPNYEDLSFVRILLDEVSLAHFQQHLPSLDQLSRAQVWRAHFDMMKETCIHPTDYCKFVLSNLQSQTSDNIFEDALQLLSTTISKWCPSTLRLPLYHEAFLATKQLLSSLPDSNRTVVLKDKLIDFARTPQDCEYLITWFQDSAAWKTPNLTLMWKIVTRVSGSPSVSLSLKQQLLKTMQQKDVSDVTLNKTLLCQGLTATPEQHAILRRRLFTQDSNLSTTNRAHLMAGLNHEIHCNRVRENSFAAYFATLAEYSDEALPTDKKWFIERDYFESFIQNMDPVLDGSLNELHLKIQAFSKVSLPHNLHLARIIAKKADFLSRIAKVYAFALQSHQHRL